MADDFAEDKSALWDTAPVMQDAPLTVFGAIRAVDLLVSFATFFITYVVLQRATLIRYLSVWAMSIVMALLVFIVLLGVRKVGPDGYEWSFLHWIGFFKIPGAIRAQGETIERF